MRLSRILGLVLLSVGIGCCGGSPTSPSPTNQASVVVAFVGAPFTATVEGRTISADGQFTIPMSPGTHEISGSYSSGLLVIAFGGAALGSGGVQSGSVTNVEGVFSQIQQCAIGWGDFTRVSRTFRVRFTVTTNSLGACQ